MSQLISIDNEYKEWIASISRRFHQSQVKASVHVNRELLMFYWSLGRDIVEMQAESKWGSGFIRNLSQDLQTLLPDVKGLSRTNLLYMIKFYKLYREFVPQAEGQLEPINVPQVVGQKEMLGSTGTGDLDGTAIFDIPWGHHRFIIDKCGDDREKAFFFVKQTIENGWSRAVLLNFLDTNLYERQGKAITNFRNTLPAPTIGLLVLDKTLTDLHKSFSMLSAEEA